MKKEMEFQEKDQKAEENAKAKAAKARTKAQTDSVVGKGKGRASVVAGEPSKSAKQKGKEVLYALLLILIFAYFNNIFLARNVVNSVAKDKQMLKLALKLQRGLRLAITIDENIVTFVHTLASIYSLIPLVVYEEFGPALAWMCNLV